MQLKTLTLLMACLICAGCSTLETLHSRSMKEWPHIELYNECNEYETYGIKQKIVYSGSRNALANILWPFKCFGEDCWGVFVYPFTLAYSIVDLPLSAIADTVALPYTHTIQFDKCPTFNRDEAMKKRELLEKRLHFYSLEPSNPEHLWLISSDRFKGGRTKDEFIIYLNENKHFFKDAADKYKPEIMSIARNNAIVRWWNAAGAKENIFDQWIYERESWYIYNLNIKNRGRIKDNSK